jgi:hypothetical protein
MSFELAEGERELGSWTINYIPPDGGRYTGSLVVTDRRLLFDARFDTSLAGSLKELIIIEGSHGYVEIDKAAILKVDVKSSFLKKKVIVTVADGREHVFDYGMLSVEKLAEAVRQR